MTRLSIIVASSILLTTRLMWADTGGMPFLAGVRLFEPNQRAAIAFNGTEEVLLLSTDLRASEPTKVLEVLPLPNEPKVSKGDVAFFKKATDLINSKLIKNAPKPTGGMGGAGGLGCGNCKVVPMPAGIVTQEEHIGAHEIIVTRVVDKDGFVEWVEQYLRKAGVKNPTIPEPMKDVVAEYLKDRYRWFVFDVVELGDKLKTKDAIQYRFATDSLYYPMRITRTGTGFTNVQLLIFSRKPLRIPTGGGMQVKPAHDPIQIYAAELGGLGNKDMSDLLRDYTCWMRIWEITGPLSGFTRDILTR